MLTRGRLVILPLESVGDEEPLLVDRMCVARRRGEHPFGLEPARAEVLQQTDWTSRDIEITDNLRQMLLVQKAQSFQLNDHSAFDNDVRNVVAN
jgi:hypothetical protein